MIFQDRIDAAFKLIPLLKKYQGENGIVVAVPRGGVPIGYCIAREFGFPLEIMLTKKIGHPSSAELAIGAVSLDGEVVDTRYDVPEDYIREEVKKIRQSLQDRYKNFMGNVQPLDLAGKTVILVDDGIATGNTVIAAIHLIRKKQPAKIIVAVPVAPVKSAARLSELVDDFICPHIPEIFFGVGQFYYDFLQISDEQVLQYLKAARNN